MYGGSLAALLAAMGIAAPSLAMAADTTSNAPLTIDATADATADASTTTTTSTVSEVIVTGTRQQGVTAANSAAPVQVVGQAALVRTGAIDLASSLLSDVPSLNIDTTGGDMAALNIQAALRGLSPNDTLVLINGKRRHYTANLAVDGGSPYSGSATVDLAWIPVASIDHVEVLTDGAAAQYGTDAIAGVVNIILKKGSSGGGLQATGGSYYSGQGATGAWSINNGWNLGANGFLNVTLEEKYHNYSYAGIGDERFQTANGKLLPTCGKGLSESSAFPPNCLQFPDTNTSLAKNFPYENRVIGDPAYNQYDAEYYAGYDFTPDLELYSFGTAGYRLAAHYENYRPPSRVEGVTTTGQTVIPYPDGFDPMEEIKELDGSFTAGLKGKLGNVDFDIATTYGDDYVPVYVINSANNVLFAQLQSLSSTPLTAQTNFYDGSFEGTQWTNTIDLDDSFDVGLAAPLNVAIGGEFRRETFTLDAGEPSSYVDGGVQSFFGYSPLDASTHARTNYAGYIDVATDPIQHLHVDLAGRFEHYSDFGSALVGKATARYDFNEAFALRGTVSNGFRAPTLAEEYYSGTNVGPTFAEAQLPPNTAAALASGFQPLKPEKSDNFSVGFVAHPIDKMQVTLDVYDIQLNNRIEVTNAFFGEFAGVVIDQNILNTIAARGVQIQPSLRSIAISTFTNAADTNTVGVDLTANYATDFGPYGHVDWTADFNYNHTKFTKILPLPAQAAASGPIAAALGQTAGSPLITQIGQSDLADATPQEKAILSANWSLDKWSATVRETVYGPEYELVDAPGLNGGNGGQFKQAIGVTPITDLDIGYKVTSNVRIDVGANNLFNTFPPKAPVFGGQPADGGLVFNVPYGFAPWGINGGYYYGRIGITW
jgi:iron complex outermembrane receptor protein